MALSELAKKLGIDLARLEKNSLTESGLTFNQLRRLATFFDRGVLFFLESGPVEPSRLHSAQFRTLTNQKPDLSPKTRTLIERVERQRDLFLSLIEDLSERSHFEPPRLHTTNIKKAAATTREWLGLKNENQFDAYRSTIEAKGILVFRSNGYAGAWQIPTDSPISGFSVFDQRCPVIFVRRLLPETRQTFTLIHELAHILVHQDSFIDTESDFYSTRGREHEANEFAGLVLVPDEHLAMVADSGRPADVSGFDTWLKPYKNLWGVSGEVILRRLLEASRLSQSEYDAYRNFVRANTPSKPTSRGDRSYRYREPRHVFGTRFVRAVFDALHTDQISLAKASTYLDNLKIKDVHALEAHLANL